MVLDFVAKVAWWCWIVTDNSTESQNYVRVCAGKRAVALLCKGCLSLLMGVLSPFSLYGMYPVNFARYAG